MISGRWNTRAVLLSVVSGATLAAPAAREPGPDKEPR